MLMTIPYHRKTIANLLLRQLRCVSLVSKVSRFGRFVENYPTEAVLNEEWIQKCSLGCMGMMMISS